jgi:hypothetical protein
MTHLLGKLMPSISGIVAENHADDRKQNKDERRQRKNRVVRKRSAELRRLIVQPFLRGYF